MEMPKNQAASEAHQPANNNKKQPVTLRRDYYGAIRAAVVFCCLFGREESHETPRQKQRFEPSLLLSHSCSVYFHIYYLYNNGRLPRPSVLMARVHSNFTKVSDTK